MRVADTDILMINPDGKIEQVFKSFSDATKTMDIKGSSLISRICKNQRGSCLGYYWLKGVDYKKLTRKGAFFDWINNNVKITKNIDRNTMPIVQLDKQTYELVNKYTSLNEAAKRNGLADKNGFDAMIKCCKFSRRTAKGYIWLLAEDYENLSIDEIKEKHNEINNVNPNAKKINKYTMPVVKLDKDTYEFIERYDSIDEAAQKNDMYHKNGFDGIIRCCRFGRKSANGFAWVLEDDFNEMSREEIESCYKGKSNSFVTDRKTFHNTPVVQLKPNTYEFIKVFKSINEAAETVHVNKSGLSKCCKFQRKTSGGYSWMYLEDFNKYTLEEIITLYSQIFWN